MKNIKDVHIIPWKTTGLWDFDTTKWGKFGLMIFDGSNPGLCSIDTPLLTIPEFDGFAIIWQRATLKWQSACVERYCGIAIFAPYRILFTVNPCREKTARDIAGFLWIYLGYIMTSYFLLFRFNTLDNTKLLCLNERWN